MSLKSYIAWGVLLGLVISLYGLVCISCVKPLPPSVPVMAIEDTICVIAHDSDPVDKIIEECGLVGDVSTAVSQILARSRSRHAQCVEVVHVPGQGK